MRRGAALSAIVVGVVAGLAACSSKPSAVVQTTSSAPPTTTTSAAPTTTTLPPPTFSKSADEAAAALIKAWQAGDKVTAQRVALPAAVDALFARPAMVLQNRGCSQNQCVYKYGSGQTLVRLTATQSAPGYQITAAEYEG